MLLAPVLALLPAALAQDPAPPPTAASEEPAVGGKSRKFLMEVGFRGRYMDVPDSIIDIWYYKNDGGEIDTVTGEVVPERPHISAYSLGLEFVIKDKQANGIFYVEYMNPLIQPGYWDDVEGDPDHLDGSWLEPDKFGIVLIGANYAYEIKATNWLSFLFGAGLGGAIKIGDLNEWQPGESPDDDEPDNNADPSCGTAPEPAYMRKDHCPVDSVIQMPPAVPYIDVNIGPRFNIGDRASIRIEGGIHMVLPYGGASLGIVF